MHGETSFQIPEQGKIKSVSVTPTEYCLTDEAIKEFKDIPTIHINGNVTGLRKKILMTLYVEVNIHDITIQILMLRDMSGPQSSAVSLS